MSDYKIGSGEIHLIVNEIGAGEIQSSTGSMHHLSLMMALSKSAYFLTSLICHPLKKCCSIFTGEKGGFITFIGIRPESILPNI